MTLPVFADPESGVLDDIVDLDRYPIDQPLSEGFRRQVAEVVTRLTVDGSVQLPGFLRASAVADLQHQLGELQRYVPITRDYRSAYARDIGDLSGDESVTLDSEWMAGHITRDMIPPHSLAQRIYVAPGFKQFIAACLGRERIFEYADPLAGLVATVLPPGGTYGWHYDTTEFVVTMSVSDAESGGEFEYVPALRQVGNENLDGLRRVLEGDRGLVKTISAKPGDLQLFLGRHSLHRVTRVAGHRSRLMLVLAYADNPGVIGPIDRTRRVYGRVTEAHLTQEWRPAGSDGLIL